jgi:hypothetical protein
MHLWGKPAGSFRTGRRSRPEHRVELAARQAMANPPQAALAIAPPTLTRRTLSADAHADVLAGLS